MTDSPVDPFTTFYRIEYPGMVRLAHALTGSPEASEDVVQEAFFRIHDRMPSLDNPAGYLRTTIVNLCKDRTRRNQRDRGRTQIPQVLPLSLEATEMIDVLLALPYRQRAVLVLRYWGDWSEAEISAALGCRPGTVKTLAIRGLSNLRREISR